MKKFYYDLLSLITVFDCFIFATVIIVVLFKTPQHMRIFSYSLLNVLTWGLLGNICQTVIVQPNFVKATACIESLGLLSTYPSQAVFLAHVVSKMCHVHVFIGLCLSCLLQGFQISVKSIYLKKFRIFLFWLLSHGIVQASATLLTFIAQPGTLTQFGVLSSNFANTVVCFSSSVSVIFVFFFAFTCVILLVTALVIVLTILKLRGHKDAMTDHNYCCHKNLQIYLIVFVLIPVVFITLPSVVNIFTNRLIFHDLSRLNGATSLTVFHNPLMGLVTLTLVKPYRQALYSFVKRLIK